VEIPEGPPPEVFDPATTVPDYAKPTIAKKVKDSELVRIEDSKKMTDKAQFIIS
jgi:hypothetical protein